MPASERTHQENRDADRRLPIAADFEWDDSGRAIRFPVLMSTEQAANLLGWSRHTVRRRCADGTFPCLPRTQEYQSYRIVTAKLLRQLGLLGE